MTDAPDVPATSRDPRPARTPDAALLAILRAEPRPHDPAELAERTGIPVRTVQRTLGKLVHDRDAKRAGGGRYTAAGRRARKSSKPPA